MMKRRSSNWNRSQESGTDAEESQSFTSEEDNQENGEDSSVDVEPKEKKRRTKGKKDLSQDKKGNTPKKKASRGKKVKESDPEDEDDQDDEEEYEEHPTPKANTPKKKSNRGKKVKESDPEDEDDQDDDEEHEEHSTQKINSSRKKASRGKRSKESDLEDDQNDKEDNEENGNEKKNSAKKKAGRGRKSKDKAAEMESSETTNDDGEADDSGLNDEEAEYEVESIIDEKTIKGIRYYLIRWKGYGEESDTWEPASTLNCPEALQEYKKKKSVLKSPGDKSKKGGNKAKKTAEPQEEWDENEDFEVVRILDVHFKKNGKREFLVAWKGYSTKYDSWEPEENMDCKEMIEKFLMKCDQAKEANEKELRVQRKITDRFTLSSICKGRRLSKRNQGKQRVQYHDAE